MTEKELEDLEEKVTDILYAKYNQEIWHDFHYGLIMQDTLARAMEEVSEVFQNHPTEG